jgi:hypothetical protein
MLTQQQERQKLFLLKGCGGIARGSVSSFLPAFAVEAFFQLCARPLNPCACILLPLALFLLREKPRIAVEGSSSWTDHLYDSVV